MLAAVTAALVRLSAALARFATMNDLAPPHDSAWVWDVALGMWRPQMIGERWAAVFEPEPQRPVRCSCHRLSPVCRRCLGGGLLLP